MLRFKAKMNTFTTNMLHIVASNRYYILSDISIYTFNAYFVLLLLIITYLIFYLNIVDA